MADLIKVPFGYVLEMLYNFSNSYGVALILFAVVVKLILLPLSMKSKKSMMKMSRLAPRMKDLELKYADDKNKYQMEVMKMYKSEGVSTMGGCLWSFIPLLILIPLYQVIREPMVYLMHMSAEHATEITELIVNELALNPKDYYNQMIAASHIGDFLPQIQAAIPELAGSAIQPINFGFLGVDLTQVPDWNVFKIVTLSGWGLFLIPMVSGGFNWLSMWLTQKLNATVATNSKGEKDKEAATASATAGTMKMMSIMMPIMSIFIGFQMPAAVSIYWIAQAVVGALQEAVLTMHFRKIYDAEDEVRRINAAKQAVEDAEKERLRVERRAKLGENTTDPNTSKKKLAAKEKAAAAPAPEKKMKPDELEEFRKWKAEKEEKKHFSGDDNRPNSRGRAYKSVRYGRDTSEMMSEDFDDADLESQDSEE